MLFANTHSSVRWGAVLGLVATFATVPSFAQTANFESLSLSPGFARASTRGYTQGAFSLSNIALRDRNGNLCLGYADSAPDHIMELQQDFAQLSIVINSGGNDTTLVIQGPNDGTVRCGDDTGRNKDASIEDTNWRAGTYRVWVGAFEPGTRYNYTLTVEE